MKEVRGEMGEEEVKRMPLPERTKGIRTERIQLRKQT